MGDEFLGKRKHKHFGTVDVKGHVKNVNFWEPPQNQ